MQAAMKTAINASNAIDNTGNARLGALGMLRSWRLTVYYRFTCRELL